MFVSLSFFNRLTLLEPGPVETPIFQTAEAWAKTMDHSTADPKTLKMMKLRDEEYDRLRTKSLTSSEIAAAVKEIILGQNTNFRCYTNVDFLSDEVATKKKDPFTNEYIQMMGKRFLEEEKDKK